MIGATVPLAVSPIVHWPSRKCQISGSSGLRGGISGASGALWQHNVSDTECLRHSRCPLEWPPSGCLRSLDAYGPTRDSLGGACFSVQGTLGDVWERGVLIWPPGTLASLDRGPRGSQKNDIYLASGSFWKSKWGPRPQHPTL